MPNDTDGIVPQRPPDHRTVRSAGIGQRLKRARQHSGMTIRELGSLAGIASSVVADTENEKRIPRADTLERIAWALKVTACWLAYGDGQAPAWWSIDTDAMNIGTK